MKQIFQLIEATETGDAQEKNISLGIQVKVGEHMSVLPVTAACRSFRAFASEIEALRKELEIHLESAELLFQGRSLKDEMKISDDMSSEQIWTLLSAIAEEERFVKGFNALNEEKRREVAEYVLTCCSVFSGKAAVFSARYDSDSSLLE